MYDLKIPMLSNLEDCFHIKSEMEEIQRLYEGRKLELKRLVNFYKEYLAEDLPACEMRGFDTNPCNVKIFGYM